LRVTVEQDRPLPTPSAPFGRVVEWTATFQGDVGAFAYPSLRPAAAAEALASQRAAAHKAAWQRDRSGLPSNGAAEAAAAAPRTPQLQPAVGHSRNAQLEAEILADLERLQWSRADVAVPRTPPSERQAHFEARLRLGERVLRVSPEMRRAHAARRRIARDTAGTAAALERRSLVCPRCAPGDSSLQQQQMQQQMQMHQQQAGSLFTDEEVLDASKGLRGEAGSALQQLRVQHVRRKAAAEEASARRGPSAAQLLRERAAGVAFLTDEERLKLRLRPSTAAASGEHGGGGAGSHDRLAVDVWKRRHHERHALAGRAILYMHMSVQDSSVERSAAGAAPAARLQPIGARATLPLATLVAAAQAPTDAAGDGCAAQSPAACCEFDGRVLPYAPSLLCQLPPRYFDDHDGWLCFTALCKALGAKALWREYTVAIHGSLRRRGADARSYDDGASEASWERAWPSERLVREMLDEAGMAHLERYMVADT
jgi:hypothetical protein